MDQNFDPIAAGGKPVFDPVAAGGVPVKAKPKLIKGNWKPQRLPREVEEEDPETRSIFSLNPQVKAAIIGGDSGETFGSRLFNQDPKSGLINRWKTAIAEPPLRLENLVDDKVPLNNKALDATVGAGKGILKAGSELSSPQNLAIMAGTGMLGTMLKAWPTTRAVIGAGFTVQMVASAVNKLPGVAEAIRKGDWKTAAQLVAEAGVDGVMAFMVGKGSKEAWAQRKGKLSSTSTQPTPEAPKPTEAKSVPNIDEIPAEPPQAVSQDARVQAFEERQAKLKAMKAAADAAKTQQTTQFKQQAGTETAERLAQKRLLEKVEQARSRPTAPPAITPESPKVPATTTADFIDDIRNSRIENLDHMQLRSRLSKIREIFKAGKLTPEEKAELSTAAYKMISRLRKSGQRGAVNFKDLFKDDDPNDPNTLKIEWAKFKYRLSGTATNPTLQKGIDILKGMSGEAAVLDSRKTRVLGGLYDIPAEQRTLAQLTSVKPSSPEVMTSKAQMDIASKAIRDVTNGEIPHQIIGNIMDDLWDGIPARSTDSVKQAARDNKFKFLASNPTKGEAIGLKPKFSDIITLIDKWTSFSIRAVAERTMANEFVKEKMLVPFDTPGTENWPTNDNAIARYAVYGKPKAAPTPSYNRAANNLNASRIDAGKSSNIEFKKVKVAPWAYPVVRVALPDAKPMGPIWQGINTTIEYGKAVKLIGSLFHPRALSWQAVANQSGSFISNAAKGDTAAMKRDALNIAMSPFFSNPEFKRGFEVMVKEFRGERVNPMDMPDFRTIAPEVLEDMLRHGYNGLNPDSGKAVLDRLSSSPNSFKHNASRGLYASTRAIFDYYMHGQHIVLYQSLLANAMADNPNMSPKELSDIKWKINEHLNNSFGETNWKHLLTERKVQKLLDIPMLAKTWNFSNIKVWSQGLGGDKFQQKLVAQYAAGFIASWLLATQASNYLTTSYFDIPDKNGKKGGHSTFNNPGEPLQVSLPGMGLTSALTVGRIPSPDINVPGLTDHSFDLAIGWNYDKNGKRESVRYITFPAGFKDPMVFGFRNSRPKSSILLIQS